MLSSLYLFFSDTASWSSRTYDLRQLEAVSRRVKNFEATRYGLNCLPRNNLLRALHLLIHVLVVLAILDYLSLCNSTSLIFTDHNWTILGVCSYV